MNGLFHNGNVLILLQVCANISPLLVQAKNNDLVILIRFYFISFHNLCLRAGEK